MTTSTIPKELRAEYIKAQVDMMVALEQAHKAHPELLPHELAGVAEVQSYTQEIMQDMKSLTGKEHEIRWKGILEDDLSLSWVVAVEPIE